MENPIKDSGLEETFTITQTIDGALKSEELKTGGSSIIVTDKNKYEYVTLRAQYTAYGSIMRQIEALKEGFYTAVNRKNIIGITAGELEELLNGKPMISVKDWRENTVYISPYSESHELIKWFWKIVNSYDQTQLSHLVQFVTGTPRIPAGGFAVLESNRGEFRKFTIQPMECVTKHEEDIIIYGKTEENDADKQYPLAHTCFNRLTLPKYTSEAKLKEMLDFIVNNEIEGFGID